MASNIYHGIKHDRSICTKIWLDDSFSLFQIPKMFDTNYDMNLLMLNHVA